MRRAAARMVAGLLLWLAFAWVSTTHVPAAVDCYEQARWDGRTFVPSGNWTCLR